MSNEETGYGGARRTPRQGVGGSPVGSWLTVALAVVAVVIGFLILRNLVDDGTTAGSGAGVETSEETTDDSIPAIGDVTVPPEETTTTTTTVPRVVDGASVIVANGNSVGGSAGDMSSELIEAGYSVEDPTNASGQNRDVSAVYYDEAIVGADQVAQSVSRDLGGLEVQVVETPAPTVSGDLGSAGVLLMLGDNEAGRTIAELSASGAATAPEPASTDGESSTPTGTDA
ncbi:LytR C-terminal domain-containing protein [Ilumatobacter sp.]|uniref:LytR C-terminal domain-containing protein n=1 Tax=Ilumatobacter sp. TaxID=1967498 RepID=UPI003B530558